MLMAIHAQKDRRAATAKAQNVVTQLRDEAQDGR